MGKTIQNTLPAEVGNWISRQLFEHMPGNIVVIDRNFKILLANEHFENLFGKTEGKHCYETYKKRGDICENCPATRTFKDGKVRVNDEQGFDRNGQPAHYIVHIAPVYDETGTVSHVVEMSHDITESKSLQKEYNLLFEQAPCYMSVINRDFRIVRANKSLRQTFGNTFGKPCYEVLKHRHDPCSDCPALKTFANGNTYKSEQVGIDKNGKQTRYIVSTAPLSRSSDKFTHVIEMSTDVTELRELENRSNGQIAPLSNKIRNALAELQKGVGMINSGINDDSQRHIVKGAKKLDQNIRKITELLEKILE